MEDATEALLREMIQEDLKNIYSKHKKTVDSQRVLKAIHDAPKVMDTLTKINSPTELAAVLQALIDACPIVKKSEVLRALGTVQSHEKQTRK